MNSTYRKGYQICDYQSGEGKLMKVVKRYKLPDLSTRNVMDTMINIINTAVYYIWKFCFFFKKIYQKIYLILQDKGD